MARTTTPPSSPRPPWTFEPGYVYCETGVYCLVGTMPAYMESLLFATEQDAREAVVEAKGVLQGTAQPSARCAQAYQAGTRLVA